MRKGKIIGRGWHRKAGEPHAEIEAIRSLKRPADAAGATIYVTLEPCSTHGRTPPCCDAIRANGFARVVIGAVDPNPAHAGRGVEILRAAGIEVEAGILAEECTALNRAFNKWIVTRVPWVIAKAGMSLDGRFTRPPGEGQWLTSPESRAHAMGLRASVDAILVGAETVRADDPQLTLRGLPDFAEKQPWRVVLTRSGDLPQKAKLFTDAHRERTLVFQRKPLRSVLRELGKRGISSVLIEGGGEVLGEAFDRRLVDEAHFYLAPMLCGGPTVIGGRGAATSWDSVLLNGAHYDRIGDDLHISGFTLQKPIP